MTINVTNPNSRPIVTAESTTTGVSIGIDYTTYYDRIATALETIATNSTAIKNNIDTITTNSTAIKNDMGTIADKQTAMETYQQKLKELGEGTGIHIIGPWDWIGLVSLYKLFIEEGKILDDSKDVDSEQLAAAIARFEAYMAKLQTLPTMY